MADLQMVGGSGESYKSYITKLRIQGGGIGAILVIGCIPLIALTDSMDMSLS